jgi:hypothetical protein
MAYQDRFVQVDGLKTRSIEDDRANVFERACLLKESFPQLDLHIVDNCKHLVQWDAMDRFHELAASSLPN